MSSSPCLKPGSLFLSELIRNNDGSPAKFGGDVEAHRVLFFCCPQWLADDTSIGVGADAERRQVATLGMRWGRCCSRQQLGIDDRTPADAIVCTSWDVAPSRTHVTQRGAEDDCQGSTATAPDMTPRATRSPALGPPSLFAGCRRITLETLIRQSLGGSRCWRGSHGGRNK
jgi:hypothetical protein